MLSFLVEKAREKREREKKEKKKLSVLCFAHYLSKSFDKDFDTAPERKTYVTDASVIILHVNTRYKVFTCGKTL